MTKSNELTMLIWFVAYLTPEQKTGILMSRAAFVRFAVLENGIQKVDFDVSLGLVLEAMKGVSDNPISPENMEWLDEFANGVFVAQGFTADSVSIDVQMGVSAAEVKGVN